MNFGKALELLKQGKKIMRKGWNGKNMYVEVRTLYDVKGYVIDNPGLLIKTPTDYFNNWVPSITDLFAEDWEELI
jgi:hypothetical protein